MQRGHLQRAWKAWRATIVAVAAVIAIGSLASASPSLRAPRGPHEPLVTGPTGITGVERAHRAERSDRHDRPRDRARRGGDRPAVGGRRLLGLRGPDRARQRDLPARGAPGRPAGQPGPAELARAPAGEQGQARGEGRRRRRWRRPTVGGRLVLVLEPRSWSERGVPRQRRWQRREQRRGQRQGPLSPPNLASRTARSSLATRERRPRRGPPLGARSRLPAPSARAPRRRR